MSMTLTFFYVTQLLELYTLLRPKRLSFQLRQLQKDGGRLSYLTQVTKTSDVK